MKQGIGTVTTQPVFATKEHPPSLHVGSYGGQAKSARKVSMITLTKS